MSTKKGIAFIAALVVLNLGVLLYDRIPSYMILRAKFRNRVIGMRLDAERLFSKKDMLVTHGCPAGYHEASHFEGIAHFQFHHCVKWIWEKE